MLGRKKVAGKDEGKIRVLLGLSKSACENMGGTYKEIDGKPACFLRVEDNEFRKVISSPDVDIIDVGERVE